MRDKEKIYYTENIGYVEKRGRMLNLGETHSIICKNKHNDITHLHDPITDVILTKCIFNYIINKITPPKLYNLYK